MSKGKPRDYWEKLWDEERLGFHLNRVHPVLEKVYEKLNLQSSAEVFLPLCGKSLDINFFGDRGHRVVGVEYSRKALDSFFEIQELETDSNSLNPRIHQLRAKNYELYHADFFDLTPEITGKFDLIYDRASILVFPPFDQKRYVQHLRSFLKPGGQILLIALEYPDREMEGPPFSTPPHFIETLFGKRFKIERIQRKKIESEKDTLIQAGLSTLHEDVYLMSPRENF